MVTMWRRKEGRRRHREAREGKKKKPHLRAAKGELGVPAHAFIQRRKEKKREERGGEKYGTREGRKKKKEKKEGRGKERYYRSGESSVGSPPTAGESRGKRKREGGKVGTDWGKKGGGSRTPVFCLSHLVSAGLGEEGGKESGRGGKKRERKGKKKNMSPSPAGGGKKEAGLKFAKPNTEREKRVERNKFIADLPFL